MTESDHSELASILDAQYDDYQAMMDIGHRQRNCLSRNDLPELDDSFTQMQACMDRIHMRDSSLPHNWQQVADPAIVERRADLRQIIGELDRIRQLNEESVRNLLEDTKRDLKRSQSGHRAVRNYLSHNSGAVQVHDARFYDGRK
tara:strand:+ start:168 stop:602 length:435 start_codon:yes stop_codon:yes gene_type:complete